MQPDPLTASARDQRLRMACADLERRVRAGETDVAKRMLNEHSDLVSDTESVIELIYSEFVTLEELGGNPSAGRFLDEFPQWRDRLMRLLKVHEAFSDDDVDRPSQTIAEFDTTPDDDVGPARETSAPRPIRQLGQYELLREIDRGGMGIVHQARQRGLNRIVAVKTVRSTDVSSTERLRFRAEAEAAAMLQHPNIVQIFEVGEQDGDDFLSMEFVEGGSLEKHLAGKPFSVHESASLIATLADAMGCAHETGIVHRDLKPGNILLDRTGTPKITDFGLARRITTDAQNQTQTGAVLGTPCYMSPEQASGRNSDIGPHTDIHALGAILYELLTGRPPFLCDSVLETLERIRRDQAVPPSRVRDRIPRDLDTICLKCLEKDPGRRYSTAQELADDLRRFLNHELIHARRVGLLERAWRYARRRPAVTGLATLLLSVSAAAALVVTRQHHRFDELSGVVATTEQKVERSEKRASDATAEADANFRKVRDLVESWSHLGLQLQQQPGMGKTAEQTLERALGYYEAFLQEHGGDHGIRWEAARAYERAGIIQIELGQCAKAEETLQSGVALYETLDPTPKIRWEKSGSYIQLAHAQRHQERWEQSEASYRAAIDLLDRLVAEHPDNNDRAIRLANTLLNLCVILNENDRTELALTTYVRAIRLQRQSIERRAELNPMDSEPGTGLSPVEAAVAEIHAGRHLRRRLVAQKKKLIPSLAANGFLSELALSIDDVGLVFMREDKLDAAEVAYREALELRQLTVKHAAKNDWEKFYLARSYDHVADVSFEHRQYEQAITSFETAAGLLGELSRTYPTRTDFQSELSNAFRQVGNAQARLGRGPEALKSYRRAAAIHEMLAEAAPTVVRFRKSWAKTCRRLAWLFLSEPDAADANSKAPVKLARRAVELDPESELAWQVLGATLYSNNEFEEAQTALVRAIELADGGEALDWFLLGMTYARQERLDLARQWIERANRWCRTQDPLDEELARTQREAAEILHRMESGEAGLRPADE